MALKLDFGSSELNKNLNGMSNKLAITVLMYATTKASGLQAYMKEHRPWTDRTGLAKATLNAKVSQPSNTTIRITLSHGVDYGKWLELAHGKNWAIIGPTINTEGPKVLEGFENLMSKLKI